MVDFTPSDIADVAARVLGIEIPKTWSGVDAVLPLLERMREEGAVVILKWDGERKLEAGEGPYTAVVQGGLIGDDFERIDAATLEEALCTVIGGYAEQAWKHK